MLDTDTIKKQHAVWRLRLHLALNGYRPVALLNNEKFPKGASAVEWTINARRDPPDACCQIANPTLLNTGILCDTLRAIDIDVDDPAKAQIILEYLLSNFGCAPIRYRTNSPRLLLLYASDNDPSKLTIRDKTITTDAVEILGHGNQFAADGMHPSGVPYLWRNGSPETVQRAELISLSDHQVETFAAFCASVLGIQAPTVRSVQILSTVQMSTDSGQWCIGDLKSALAEVTHLNQNYSDWFEMACAVHHATNGSLEGFSVWCEWSMSCASYTDAAAVNLWNSLRKASRGKQITAGTLYAEVMRVNPAWVKPSTTFSQLRCFQPKP